MGIQRWNPFGFQVTASERARRFGRHATVVIATKGLDSRGDFLPTGRWGELPELCCHPASDPLKQDGSRCTLDSRFACCLLVGFLLIVPLLYLDYNRTTPTAPSVLEAMQPYWGTYFMLPEQQHWHATAIDEAVTEARESLGALAGCEGFEIVFTSGGTESNQLAIAGLLGTQHNAGRPQRGGHILVSALECDSVLDTVQRLARQDPSWTVEQIPIAGNGLIDPQTVEQMICGETRLVCVQAANPILGTIQPVAAIGELCAHRGVHLHCDATQVFGKIPVNVKQMKVDTASISSHKFYGPKGVGALYVRRGLAMEGIHGGDAGEMGLRPGSPNVTGIVGMGAAAQLAERFSLTAEDPLEELRDQFIARLEQAMPDPPAVIAAPSETLPNTLAIEMPDEIDLLKRSARDLVMNSATCFDPPDYFVRSLRAIGMTDRQIRRSVSFSLGWTTSNEQIERAAEWIAAAYYR